MSPTPDAKKNPPIIVTRAPWRVLKVTPMENYTLEVEFVDGVRGLVDMSRRVMSEDAGVFAFLRDISFFNKVYLEYGVVTWPGEIDLAPDAMHDQIQRYGKWILK